MHIIQTGKLAKQDSRCGIVSVGGSLFIGKCAKMDSDAIALNVGNPELAISSPRYSLVRTRMRSESPHVTEIIGDGTQAEVRSPVVQAVSVDMVDIYVRWRIEQKSVQCDRSIGVAGYPGPHNPIMRCGHREPMVWTHAGHISGINERNQPTIEGDDDRRRLNGSHRSDLHSGRGLERASVLMAPRPFVMVARLVGPR